MVVVTATAPAGPSFEEVRRVHAAAVHRLCVVALGHPAEAEQVAARVLATAAAAYPIDQPGPARLLPWLLGVACEVIGSAPPARRGRRAPGAVASGWGREVDDALVRAAGLEPRERLAAGLRCAAGLEYAEIGEILGLQAAAARAACAAGLGRIRDGGRPRR
jgi:DNA-directed RNA polymerase specialized sigma24 family protein